MTHDDEVCSDLFGDPSDLLSGGPHTQPRRRREAQQLKALDAFRKDGFVICDLFVYRNRQPTLQARDRSYFYNGQPEDLGAAELRDLRSLPQRAPSFD